MQTIEAVAALPFICSKKWYDDIETRKMLIAFNAAFEDVSSKSHCLKISITEESLEDDQVKLVMHFEYLTINELNLAIPIESIKLKDMRYANRGALVGSEFLRWIKEKETVNFNKWLRSLEDVIYKYFVGNYYVRYCYVHFRIYEWPDGMCGKISEIIIDLLGIEINSNL